jgi:hypothetical protein
MVVECRPACEIPRMSSFRNLIVFLLTLAPVSALADGNRIVLSEDLGLSAVCWENPYEEGWESFSVRSEFSASRYDLLVFETENLPGSSFFEEPFQFRLIVRAFPCFYEYGNHRYSGHGSYLTSSGPPQRTEVDSYSFPYTVDENIIVPVIQSLVTQCERSYPQPWPFTHPFPSLLDCERAISDMLISETTAVYVYNDPAAPWVAETILFIQGLPYYDGEPLTDPAAMGLH